MLAKTMVVFKILPFSKADPPTVSVYVCMGACVCVWRLELEFVGVSVCVQQRTWVTRAGCWRCRRDRLVRAKTFPCGRQTIEHVAR